MLKNILVCVGHGKSEYGGYDPGACHGGYQEYVIARGIAKAVKEELGNYECNVTLINTDKEYSLTDRIVFENKGNYDLTIEIHLNAGKGTGTEVYHAAKDATSKKIAATISRSLSIMLDIKDRGAKTKIGNGTDYFGIIRETKSTALLIETCFIDSSDVQKVNTTEKQTKAGEAIALAIAAALSLPEKKTEKFIPFRVKVNVPVLRIRKGAGTKYGVVGYIKYKGVYTITATKKVGSTEWGKLKSGAGWISLKYCKKV